MSPQQYAFDNGISVQEAKRRLGKRRSKNTFHTEKKAKQSTIGTAVETGQFVNTAEAVPLPLAA